MEYIPPFGVFGLTGQAVTAGSLSGSPTPNRFEPAAVSSYLGSIVPFLDVDGDGKADPLTDGVMLVRYLLGLREVALTTGPIAAGATRTPAQIESFILELRH